MFLLGWARRSRDGHLESCLCHRHGGPPGRVSQEEGGQPIGGSSITLSHDSITWWSRGSRGLTKRIQLYLFAHENWNYICSFLFVQETGHCGTWTPLWWRKTGACVWKFRMPWWDLGHVRFFTSPQDKCSHEQFASRKQICECQKGTRSGAVATCAITHKISKLQDIGPELWSLQVRNGCVTKCCRAMRLAHVISCHPKHSGEHFLLCGRSYHCIYLLFHAKSRKKLVGQVLVLYLQILLQFCHCVVIFWFEAILDDCTSNQCTVLFCRIQKIGQSKTNLTLCTQKSCVLDGYSSDRVLCRMFEQGKEHHTVVGASNWGETSQSIN